MPPPNGAATSDQIPSGCLGLTVQSPLIWVSTLVAKAQQDEQKIQTRVEARVHELEADAKRAMAFTETELQALIKSCERYGVDIESLVKSAVDEIGPAATEGVKLGNALLADIAVLIPFFTGIAADFPNTQVAAPATAIAAGLTAFAAVLKGVVTLFGATATTATDAQTLGTAASGGDPTKVQAAAARVVKDFNNGMTAAVAGGIVSAKQAKAVTDPLNATFNAALLEANLAGKAFKTLTVQQAPSRIVQRAAPATGTAPALTAV